MIEEVTMKALEDSMSYEEYRNLIRNLLSEEKTTGSIQSEEMTHYTEMNESRMTRIDKKGRISPTTSQFLEDLSQPYRLLIITEAWCGDAAQVIPYIEKIAAISDKLTTHYILRDENPTLMDYYLTEGGRSIPKIILVGEKVLGSWGPRPEEPQRMVLDRKKSENQEPYSTFVVKLQKWYNKDKGKAIQNEFSGFLKENLPEEF